MSSWACVLGVMTSQHVSLSNTNWASGFSPTIRSPNNVDSKSTEERPHQQKSTPTLPTHKHTDKHTRPWRVKGASPRSLTLIASERITSPEKSIRPECVQPCKEVWIKVGLLYLEGLGWINATQRLAGPPFPHIWLSKTCQCWPRLHSAILKERRLTYSGCAALRTSLWSDTKVFDAQPPPPMTLTFHLHKDRNDTASHSSRLQLPRLCLKRWWMHKLLSSLFCPQSTFDWLIAWIHDAYHHRRRQICTF